MAALPERDAHGMHPAFTLRSVAAALLAMLLMAVMIQYSTVVLGMESAGEYGLPLPAVLLLAVLLCAGGLARVLARWQLLSRSELLCVFYTMVIGAPLMTQGFWHRVLSITATIPRGGEFSKIDYFSDRLWPHGPNLLAGAFEKPIILEGDTEQGIASHVARIPAAGAGGVVPGEPYLFSLQARAERLGGNAYYFVRARAVGGDLYQEVLRSRAVSAPDALRPEGFVRVGDYGFVFSNTDKADEIEIEFGLAGQGRVELRDPKLMNVAALEYAYTGLLILPEDEYLKLPPGERAGIIPRPATLLSLPGLKFLAQAYIPYEAWLTPIFSWGALLALILAGALSINVIMRRQWIEGERYPLPLARIASLVVGEPEGSGGEGVVWRNRILWAGLALGLFWGLMRGFHFYNPAVPDLNIKVDLGPYFGPAWGDFWTGVTFQVVGIFVAVAVFVELNVLMSLLAGYFAYRGLFWAGYASGLASQPGFPFPQQQQTGAFVAYGLLVLALSGRYLKGTLLEAVRPSPRPEADREIFSYRTAYLILAAVFVGAVLWAGWVGVSAGGMIFYMAFLLLISLVASKFRAEAGVAFGYFTPLNAALMLLLLGGIPVFGADLVLLTFVTSFILSVAVFFLIPGAQLEIMELGRRYRIVSRHILATIVLGAAGGLIIGGWVFLSNAYANGGDTMRYAWAFETKTWYFGDFNMAMGEAAATSPAKADAIPISTWAYVFGGGVSVALGILRQLFAGFWLHPIGFILGPSYLCQMIWGSILVAWILRFIVVRFGGAQAVRLQLQPFFVGVFMGAVGSWAVWFVYGTLLRARGVEMIYGALP